MTYAYTACAVTGLMLQAPSCPVTLPGDDRHAAPAAVEHGSVDERRLVAGRVHRRLRTGLGAADPVGRSARTPSARHSDNWEVLLYGRIGRRRTAAIARENARAAIPAPDEPSRLFGAGRIRFRPWSFCAVAARDPGSMEIELVVVADCPNEKTAAERLRQALDDIGLHSTGFTLRVISDQAEAERNGFTGSPTILIDGRDPFAEPGRRPGLACRLYWTPDGPDRAPGAGQLRQALKTAADRERELAEIQRDHWQHAYQAHPSMYGTAPSTAALHAAAVFRTAGVTDVLELGAGHGRDTLYLAREGFTVRASDFSTNALDQLRRAARTAHLAGQVSVMVHDIREPLPLPDTSVDAVFAHMLLCMALTTTEIRAAVGEIRRVLRPGGVFVYTVRHTGDAHYRTGTAHSEDIWEHGGFAVHFFPRHLVDDLADGWTLNDIHPFEEGDLPRRLWCVTQTKPR